MPLAGWIADLVKKSRPSSPAQPSRPSHPSQSHQPHQALPLPPDVPHRQPQRKSRRRLFKQLHKTPQQKTRNPPTSEMNEVGIKSNPIGKQSKKRVVIDLLSDDSGDEQIVPKRASKLYQMNPRSNNPPLLPAVDRAVDLFKNGAAELPAEADRDDDDMRPPQDFEEMWEDLYGDNIDGFGVQNEDPTRTMMDDFKASEQKSKAKLSGHPRSKPVEVLDPKTHCLNRLIEFFPGICGDYVSELYDTVSQDYSQLIPHVLDKPSYPKAKDVQKSMKRKRELDEDEEAARKYGAANRDMADNKVLVRNILRSEFLDTPMEFIDTCLKQNGFRLFSAYRILEEAERTYDERPTYNKIKHPRKVSKHYTRENIQVYIDAALTPVEHEIYEELAVAWKFRDKEDIRRQEVAKLELAEQENERKAIAEGTMSECNCCFSDFPLNRMVHCDNPEAIHWFCRGCARMSAETEIGNSKFELFCMSMDGCSAGFSNQQRKEFLDEKTTIALERNHQEANLRMAGIENLASCPFCPYAAEYPPVEENREFACQRPDCEKVSCRLCHLESHVPMTCEEFAKENGLSIRRQIEEAMSAALIRKCNRCETPFVKEEGCNKMTCTRPNCRNVQCYVCSQSCGYGHFNDPSRGGKAGNCPLFESTETRHDKEVQKAEQDALDRIMAEHPEYTEEELKVQVSDAVKADDERRKANHPRNHVAGRAIPIAGNGQMYPGPWGPMFAGPLFQPPNNLPPFNPRQPPDMANGFGVFAAANQHLWFSPPGRDIDQRLDVAPIPHAIPAIPAQGGYVERLQRERALFGNLGGRIAVPNPQNIAGVAEQRQALQAHLREARALRGIAAARIRADLAHVEDGRDNAVEDDVAQAAEIVRARRARVNERMLAYRRQFEG